MSLIDSRWPVLRHLRFDGDGERVDAIKAEGHARFADHIVLEGLSILNHGPWQDVVAISTKCPASGWVVRNNLIVGAATGMYLGQSDGSAPFVAGLIEGNRVLDPVGSGIQIKHQLARSGPVAPQVTAISHNRLIKVANSSTGKQARPNLLIGHVPLTGLGKFDGYRVYANVLFNNPSESLLQAEGNLVIYNNLFSNPHGDALRVMAHKHRPRAVVVFHNTAVTRGIGIEISGGEPGYERSAIWSGLSRLRPRWICGRDSIRCGSRRPCRRRCESCLAPLRTSLAARAQRPSAAPARLMRRRPAADERGAQLAAQCSCRHCVQGK